MSLNKTPHGNHSTMAKKVCCCGTGVGGYIFTVCVSLSVPSPSVIVLENWVLFCTWSHSSVWHWLILAEITRHFESLQLALSPSNIVSN